MTRWSFISSKTLKIYHSKYRVRSTTSYIHVCLSKVPINWKGITNIDKNKLIYNIQKEHKQEALKALNYHSHSIQPSPDSMSLSTCSALLTISSLKPATNTPC